MTERADVVIVGGGIIGLSCARELRGAGVNDVVVCEALPSCGQGSSARANGGVRAQWTTEPNVRFALYSIDAIEELAREHSDVLTFHQNGYLLFTGERTRAASLRDAYEVQRAAGAAVEWLEPAGILARAPFLRPDGLVAGTFHGRDGFLDPHSLVIAMKRSAEAAGARVVTSAPIIAIEPDGHAWLVRHPRGEIRCDRVVNAAGAHAGSVAALVGADLPVRPVRRNLAYLHDPAGPGELIPMCVDLDTGVLVRREVGGGFVISYSDPADPETWDTTLDPRFLARVAERIGNRFPGLEELPLDPGHCWAGLYPETPDNQAIIGAFPDRAGVIHCAGFGGHGLMHSPAAGRAVAELIELGHCATFDLRAYRPTRFAEGDLNVESGAL